ncbi:hypothetical protein E4U41_003993 [Claviceps citrina]|nr:hypothetical protein E4U41_003993 [Claviceps citrina]
MDSSDYPPEEQRRKAPWRRRPQQPGSSSSSSSGSNAALDFALEPIQEDQVPPPPAPQPPVAGPPVLEPPGLNRDPRLVFVIDDSVGDSPQYKCLIQAMTEFVRNHGEDGIDVYFLSDKSELGDNDALNVRDPAFINGLLTKRANPTDLSITQSFHTISRILSPYHKALNSTALQYAAPDDDAAPSDEDDLSGLDPIHLIVVAYEVPLASPDDIIGLARLLDKFGLPPTFALVQFIKMDSDFEEEWEEFADAVCEARCRNMVDVCGYKDKVTQSGIRALSAEGIWQLIVRAHVRRRMARQVDEMSARLGALESG